MFLMDTIIIYLANGSNPISDLGMIIQSTNFELPQNTTVFHLIYHVIMDRCKISDYLTCAPSPKSSGVKVWAMCNGGLVEFIKRIRQSDIRDGINH